MEPSQPRGWKFESSLSQSLLCAHRHSAYEAKDFADFTTCAALSRMIPF